MITDTFQLHHQIQTLNLIQIDQILKISKPQFEGTIRIITYEGKYLNRNI